MKHWLGVCLLSLMASLPVHAAIDTYEFANEAERARYSTLIAELRCPKCQNQNIADSNAPIAMDLRAQIYGMLEAGKTNDEIVEQLVLRYGDFVRYKPPLDNRTWLLWFGPGILLLIGLLALVLIVRRRRSTSETQLAELSVGERERLASLLDKQDR